MFESGDSKIISLVRCSVGESSVCVVLVVHAVGFRFVEQSSWEVVAVWTNFSSVGETDVFTAEEVIIVATISGATSVARESTIFATWTVRSLLVSLWEGTLISCVSVDVFEPCSPVSSGGLSKVFHGRDLFSGLVGEFVENAVHLVGEVVEEVVRGLYEVTEFASIEISELFNIISVFVLKILTP